MTDNDAPRKPTEPEKQELAEYTTQTCYQEPTPEDLDQQISFADEAYIVVFDHYITDCPGYAGKVMVVVWSGAPEFHQVFIWRDGKIDNAKLDEGYCLKNGSPRGLYDDAYMELDALCDQHKVSNKAKEEIYQLILSYIDTAFELRS